MTRRLIVMRHAKSSWDDPALSDHQRPLNNRGRKDAPKVAEKLVQLGWQPDYVISSDSARTRETFDRMRDCFDQNVPVEFYHPFYHAGLDAVREKLAGLADQYETVLILGHNPGWEEVVRYLTGQPVTLKTAAAALLTSAVDTWSALSWSAASWTLVDLIQPRDF